MGDLFSGDKCFCCGEEYLKLYLFQLLMDRLISRYLSRIEEKEEEKVITWEDLEEVKQDLLKEITILAQGKKKLLWRQSLVSKVTQKERESTA